MRCLRIVVAMLSLLSLSPTLAATNWELVRQDAKRDIRVYVRDVPNSNYQGFYAVTRVEARLSTVVAVLSDVPAMPEWIARLRQTRLLKREADTDVWVHNIYKLPYPFLDREAVLHSTLRQEKNGVVEVVTRAEKGLIPSSRRVRLLDMHSTWRLTPEGKGMVRIELWGQGDPGGYMPPVLFNYNLPDEPAQTLKLLRQMLTRDKYRQRKPGYIRES